MGGGHGVTGAFPGGHVKGLLIGASSSLTTWLHTQLGNTLNSICHLLPAFAKTATGRADLFKMRLFASGKRQSGQLTSQNTGSQDLVGLNDATDCNWSSGHDFRPKTRLRGLTLRRPILWQGRNHLARDPAHRERARLGTLRDRWRGRRGFYKGQWKWMS